MAHPTIGIVPYLNMIPLLEGLDQTFSQDQWIRATPRELAGLLKAGEIDIAAVSVFEGLRCADCYVLIPGAAIGSDGPVRSVALYSKLPISQIKTVLLDYASLTSVHLVRILLKELYDLEPEYLDAQKPLAPDFDWQHSTYDAFVTIGDTALCWENAFPHRLDLGEGWKRLTGLPFVFAAWWARRDLELTPSQLEAFENARQAGCAHLRQAVARLDREWVDTHGGPESVVTYLGESIRYELGERELEALELFRQKLIRAGFLPREIPEPEFLAPCEQKTP